MIRYAIEKDIPKITDLLMQVCLVHHNGTVFFLHVVAKQIRPAIPVGALVPALNDQISNLFPTAAANAVRDGIAQQFDFWIGTILQHALKQLCNSLCVHLKTSFV